MKINIDTKNKVHEENLIFVQFVRLPPFFHNLIPLDYPNLLS